MSTELLTQTKEESQASSMPRDDRDSASPAANNSASDRASDKGLIALVIIIFAIFTVGTIASLPQRVSLDEKRTLAGLPHFSVKHFADFRDGFESYFGDRLFLRQTLIRLRACTKYLLWKSSTTAKFTAGKDGWLYLIFNWCGPDVRHELHMTPSQLASWERVLKYRTQWFEKRGIHYVFFVAPNKDTIYPEYLSAAYKPIGPTSRLDELTQYLRVGNGFTFVNPVPEVVQGKSKQQYQIYSKTDTHWNDIGALYAYNALVKSLRQWYPSLTPMQIQDFTCNLKLSEQEDMATGMGLQWLLKEYLPVLVLKDTVKRPSLPVRVTLLHDSFGPCLKQYFERDFSHMTYHHKTDLDFSMEEIAAEHPNLVIEEVVERHVAQVIPSIYEWRKWASETVSKHTTGHDTVWLDIVPNTPSLNVRTFAAYTQPPGSRIEATTCRVYTDHGDKVTFNQGKALLHDWYLLADGDQGIPLLDKQSRGEYQQLIDFIMHSGKFQQMGQCHMADGSTLSLYRRLNR